MRISPQRGGWAAVVINYNGEVFLDGCLRALSRCLHPPSEIVVVDNASSDESLLELNAWPQVVVEASQTNLGFAGGANRGVVLTETPIVVFLNPDVEVDADFGTQLLQLFNAQPSLGVAGPKLRYPDSGLIQHAGGRLDWPLLTAEHRGYGLPDEAVWQQPADVDFVTGGAMALRRVAFDQVGGFDEQFWPAYYEDVDLCLRLRGVGWQVRYEPALTAIHVESVTLGRSPEYHRIAQRNRIRLALKHLSPEEWWERFIPAELARLRGDLSAIDNPAWTAISGADALEQLARSLSVREISKGDALDGEPLATAIVALGELRSSRLVRPGSRPNESEPGGRLRAWRRRLSSRAYAEELAWRQQAFNDAVVRALEAQDRLNREQTATLLLLMLDLIGHQRDIGGRPSAG